MMTTSNNILLIRVPCTSVSPTASNKLNNPTDATQSSITSIPPLPYYTVSSSYLSTLLDQTKSLFLDYRLALLSHDVPIDLFQGFSQEIEALPYKYIKELKGTILLAVIPLIEQENKEYDEATKATNAPIVISSDTTNTTSNSNNETSTSTVPIVPPFTIIIDKYSDKPILVRTVGCIALKDIGGDVGEVKRLYILPPYRRYRIGYTLSLGIEYIAKYEYQYKKLVLDTLKRLDGALPLYERLGYQQCDAYVYNPMPDVVFLEKKIVIEP